MQTAAAAAATRITREPRGPGADRAVTSGPAVGDGAVPKGAVVVGVWGVGVAVAEGEGSGDLDVLEAREGGVVAPGGLLVEGGGLLLLKGGCLLLLLEGWCLLLLLAGLAGALRQGEGWGWLRAAGAGGVDGEGLLEVVRGGR